MTDEHPLIGAVAPLVDILGAEVVAAAEMTDGDIALEWEGDLVGAVRLPAMQNALHRLVAVTEHELGASLAELDRVGKQRAVRMLEERGAFQLRRSIEEVADLMGVSRITIYNYLNTVRDAEAS